MSLLFCGPVDLTLGTSSAYVQQASQLIDARNRRGMTALHVAASQGHTTMVKALVEGGASSPLTDTVPASVRVCCRRRWGSLVLCKTLIASGFGVCVLWEGCFWADFREGRQS